MTDFVDEANIQIIEKLYKGKMNEDPHVQALIDEALMTNDYEPLKHFLENHSTVLALAESNIAIERVGQLEIPFTYPTHDEVLEHLNDGDLDQGYINKRNDKFYIHSNDLCMLTIVLGRPGSGKSKFLQRIATISLSKSRNYNIVIPDRKGNEYRNLLPYSKHRLKVIQKHKLKFNPFQVPGGIDPQQYLVFITRVFVAENWLGSTSLGVLISIVFELYRKNGVFDGSLNYPTCRDVYNSVEQRLNDKESFKYRDILLLIKTRLIPYVHDPVFDCKIGIPYDVLWKENVVIEINGFQDNVYSTIICIIAGVRYEYNMKYGIVGALSTLILIDETRVLQKVRDTEAFGESYFLELLSMCRAPGIGFILASQEPSSFSQTAKSLSFTRICFPLMDGYDKDWIQKSFSLNDAQVAYLGKMGRYGTAICSYGGFERPFLLGVPHFKIKHNITNEEVEKSMAGFYAELDAKIKVATSIKPIAVIESVPAEAATLMINLSKEPYTNKSEMLAKFSGFKSHEQITKNINWLVDHGYAVRQEIKLKKKGHPASFCVLTHKAYAYLKVKPPTGKGGFEHQYYSHFLAEWYRAKGMEAEVEAPLRKGSAKTTDVLVKDKGKIISVQVALSLDGLFANLEDLKMGADEVVIVTRDTKEQDKAIKMVSGEPTLTPYLERITFKTIGDFFS